VYLGLHIHWGYLTMFSIICYKNVLNVYVNYEEIVIVLWAKPCVVYTEF
jgi:hypothetical protein